jgi:hypothetical protein
MTKSTLTRNAFDASRKFIETSARPLEIARFHHAFDGGPEKSVSDSLKQYQNPDGGFGHALEPDFRASESSVLCTSLAFQILRSIHANPDDDLVSSGIAYFLNTLDRTEAHWRIIPRMVQDSPHAPWWDQAGRQSDFDPFSLNPTAEILGYLYDYLEEQHHPVLSLVSQRVINQLSGLQQIEMHELLCCLRLLQTQHLPEEIERPVHQKLLQLVDGTISTDPEQWKGYGLRPLQVVDRPESPFMAGREASVAANLDYEITTHNADGSWSPTWTWGGMYPDDWIIASRQWSGVLTLDKLLLLKRFHRIEGI